MSTPKKSVSLIVEKKEASLNNIPRPIIGLAVLATISIISFIGSRPTPLEKEFRDRADYAQSAAEQTEINMCTSVARDSHISFEQCMNGVTPAN